MSDKKNVTVTVTLNASEYADLTVVNGHRRSDRDVADTAHAMLVAGVNGMLYRYARNRKKWQEQKAREAYIAELEAKLAVKEVEE